ncbi:L,D-transpeptidase family protein [Rhodopila sp.]|uniref:L,D-transpeptidase family protein n=1 Tax=Rhodopila sp. TaxID=2480087 RepID=UPI002C0FB643|nr:L,D-transpeptidase family protein [Rhodopila sp.]HVZ09072.1 L,D-transpeptidase family protein [Rhodopila sp.]
MQAIVTADGLFIFGSDVFRSAIGKGGVRADKREGDGATPLATMRLVRVLYRPDREAKPETAVPVVALTPMDGWCDDPALPVYNQRVTLPIAGSAEALWREDGLYDIIGVLDWNLSPVVPGRGSAIFLHIARPDYTPTEGCVALAPADLRRVLAMGLTEIAVRA